MIMRRKDREKDASFAFEVLRDCEYATLATINTDGTPYCVPISPILIDNKVYFHCATEGQKLENIDSKNTVCISGVRHTKLIPEEYTTEYESAVASGKCTIVTDEQEKITALREICKKYAKNSMENIDRKIAESLHKTCICKIKIKQITGKANT